jgi:F0F1-type ATP synthase assembly protein I
MNPDRKKKSTGAGEFLKYTGIAMQMILTILILTFAGRWLDSKEFMSFPVFTILGVLTGVAAALYLILKKI